MNNLLHVKDSVVQDFNDAVTYQKANGRSRQTGYGYAFICKHACLHACMYVCRGLPLKVRVTSMMFEDRSGYQVFTVKLGPADVITDEVKFRSLPDIMMEKITTVDGGPPLYIRCVVCVCARCVCAICV